MNEFPCHNCISLAICKSQLPVYAKDVSRDDIQFQFSNLYTKCSIIKKHLEAYTTTHSYDPLIIKISFEALYAYYYPELLDEIQRIKESRSLYTKGRGKDVRAINCEGEMTIMEPANNGAVIW